MNLEQLKLQLNQGSRGKANLAGLDEQYARGKALRDSQTSKMDKYGQVSGLNVLADVINNSRGRKDLRELAPNRANARQAVAQNENTMPLYNAGVAEDKVIADAKQTGIVNALNAEKFGETQAQNTATNLQAQNQLGAQVSQWGATNELARDRFGEEKGQNFFSNIMEGDKYTSDLAQKKLDNLYRADVLGDTRGQNEIQNALNQSVFEETQNENQKANALAQAVQAQNVAEGGETVQLFNPNDPKDTFMAGKVGDTYVDANTGEPLDVTGYLEKPKATRSSGSRYTRSKSEDPFGNDVVTVFDKLTSEEAISTFGDGTPYSQEEAEKRGGQRAEQGGRETYAKEDVKIDLNAAEDAGKKIASLNALKNEMEIGITAFDEGAETGPISQFIPSVRRSTLLLENVVDRLALSDIGNYSFGALSEAEGAWLRKANLPKSMDEDDARPWLQKRVDGVKRLIQATEYEQTMRANGHKPDRKVIDQILHSEGFKFED